MRHANFVLPSTGSLPHNLRVRLITLTAKAEALNATLTDAVIP